MLSKNPWCSFYKISWNLSRKACTDNIIVVLWPWSSLYKSTKYLPWLRHLSFLPCHTKLFAAKRAPKYLQWFLWGHAEATAPSLCSRGIKEAEWGCSFTASRSLSIRFLWGKNLFKVCRADILYLEALSINMWPEDTAPLGTNLLSRVCVGQNEYLPLLKKI